MEKANIIKCISRTYSVETPAGLIIEVESRRSLSTDTLAKLLEEDSDIDEFFKDRKILNVRRVIKSPEKTTELGEPKLLTKNGKLSALQRLNIMLTMRGEFTRKDYIKYLYENFQYKLNKWTSHNDIKSAVSLNKIQIIDGKRKDRRYKVIDNEEIGESLYKSLLQDRRQHMSTLI